MEKENLSITSNINELKLKEDNSTCSPMPSINTRKNRVMLVDPKAELEPHSQTSAVLRPVCTEKKNGESIYCVKRAPLAINDLENEEDSPFELKSALSTFEPSTNLSISSVSSSSRNTSRSIDTSSECSSSSSSVKSPWKRRPAASASKAEVSEFYWEMCYGGDQPTLSSSAETATFVTGAWSAKRAPPLKSCLSSRKKSKMVEEKDAWEFVDTMPINPHFTPPRQKQKHQTKTAFSTASSSKLKTTSSLKNVKFGSTFAAEFDDMKPSLELTPLPNEFALKRYKLEETEPTEEEEEKSALTKMNTDLLSSWEDSFDYFLDDEEDDEEEVYSRSRNNRKKKKGSLKLRSSGGKNKSAKNDRRKSSLFSKNGGALIDFGDNCGDRNAYQNQVVSVSDDEQNSASTLKNKLSEEADCSEVLSPNMHECHLSQQNSIEAGSSCAEKRHQGRHQRQVEIDILRIINDTTYEYDLDLISILNFFLTDVPDQDEKAENSFLSEDHQTMLRSSIRICNSFLGAKEITMPTNNCISTALLKDIPPNLFVVNEVESIFHEAIKDLTVYNDNLLCEDKGKHMLSQLNLENIGVAIEDSFKHIIEVAINDAKEWECENLWNKISLHMDKLIRKCEEEYIGLTADYAILCSELLQSNDYSEKIEEEERIIENLDNELDKIERQILETQLVIAAEENRRSQLRYYALTGILDFSLLSMKSDRVEIQISNCKIENPMTKLNDEFIRIKDSNEGRNYDDFWRNNMSVAVSSNASQRKSSHLFQDIAFRAFDGIVMEMEDLRTAILKKSFICSRISNCARRIAELEAAHFCEIGITNNMDYSIPVFVSWSMRDLPFVNSRNYDHENNLKLMLTYDLKSIFGEDNFSGLPQFLQVTWNTAESVEIVTITLDDICRSIITGSAEREKNVMLEEVCKEAIMISLEKTDGKVCANKAVV